MQKKLNEVQQRLSEIDATKFHKMVDIYLNKKYNYSIHSTGTKTGEDKPRKGTPDTLIALDNKKYIFVEYTTQKTNIKKKFLEDIEKCLEPEKTNISLQKIDKIILACNSSLQSDAIETLKKACGDIECEVLTNSTLSYDFVNHYPFIAKEFLGIDIGNVLTPYIIQNFLQQKYTSKNFTKLKPLSSLNQDIHLQDIYQDLSIIKKKKNEEEKDKEINIDELLNESKKISILGKSGIGKSTLAKYICYQWANGELFNNYDYLFYIPIKKWEKGEGIFDVVLKVLKASKHENIDIKSDNLYEYIKSFKDKILLVIDGFDEIKDEYREEIEQDIQNFDNYIITSRHNGLKENKLNIENIFENEGFNQKSIENFIRHISNSDKLIKQINNNGLLKELSKIPMLLDMICYLYKENQIDFTTHFTMVSLYEKVIDKIISRFEKERKLQYKTIKEIDIFFELGKIAFENLKNNDFKFKGSFTTRKNNKVNLKKLEPLGFLSETIQDEIYEFIHTSFQEYFSALYVASFLKDEQSEIIQKWKEYPHMHMFFAFLGGLIKDNKFFLEKITPKPLKSLKLLSCEYYLLKHILTELEYDNQLQNIYTEIILNSVSSFSTIFILELDTKEYAYINPPYQVIYKNSEYLIDIFIEMLELNICNSIKKNILIFLFDKKHTFDEKFINNLLTIAKNKSLSDKIKWDIYRLFLFLGQYRKSILEKLEYIKNSIHFLIKKYE